MHPVNATLPFSLGEVLDAAKTVLGVPLLPADINLEVRLMAASYADKLRSYRLGVLSGDVALARQRQHALFLAPCTKVVCFLLAYPSWSERLTFENAKLQAARVNPRNPSDEKVYATERLKRSGGTRWTCSYGPRARSAQRMVEHIIFMAADPSPYEYAREGRGRERAAATVLDAIENKGVRWFGIADVKDFFPSVTREMVRKALPFLPASIVDATIFIHDDTDICTHAPSEHTHNNSAQAIRAGLPQGSISSLIVASKVLQPHLDALHARLAAVHVDNVLVGGKTGAEAETMLNALASSLGKQSAGSLRLTTGVYRLGDPDMDFLGYRFRRRWRSFGGFGRAEPADRGFRRLYFRTALALLLASPEHWTDFIENTCARWVRGYPSWEGRFRAEYFAILGLELDLLPRLSSAQVKIVKQKVRWKSFSELRDDLMAYATHFADTAEKMFTSGGKAALIGNGLVSNEF